MKPSRMELGRGCAECMLALNDIGFLGIRGITSKLYSRAGLVTYRTQFGYSSLNILKGVS